MCKILIFGGTAEGRELAQFCSKNKIPVFVSVATDYGAELIDGLPFVSVLNGRKDSVQIEDFIKEKSIELVIDATHPYATETTKNIKTACENTVVKLYRILRNETKSDGLYFDSIDGVVGYLNENNGNVLITTGSKDIKLYKKINDFENRCAVRILPMENAVENCVSLGFKIENIIAEKGPFTLRQNVNHIKRFNAEFLVTKDSGERGGFGEKIKAAKECGVTALIVKRPREDGISLEEAKELLK